MNLFTKIRELRTDAFKAGDKFYHQVLTNVFADAEKVGKDAGQRLPDDNEVMAVIKKHIKGVVEFLEAIEHSVEEGIDTVKKLKLDEKTILEEFLPKQLTEEQLKEHLKVLQPANLGDWMKFLKGNYLNQYDAKLAKAVFEAK